MLTEEIHTKMACSGKFNYDEYRVFVIEINIFSIFQIAQKKSVAFIMCPPTNSSPFLSFLPKKRQMKVLAFQFSKKTREPCTDRDRRRTCITGRMTSTSKKTPFLDLPRCGTPPAPRASSRPGCAPSSSVSSRLGDEHASRSCSSRLAACMASTAHRSAVTAAANQPSRKTHMSGALTDTAYRKSGSTRSPAAQASRYARSHSVPQLLLARGCHAPRRRFPRVVAAVCGGSLLSSCSPALMIRGAP